MKNFYGVRWSVTATSETYNKYGSEVGAERRIQDLREQWGEKLALLEVERFEGGSLEETRYLI